MVFTKKITKAPTVMVETKKLSAKDTCGMDCCGKIKHVLILAFMLLNTLLLVRVLCNQTKIESDKVGGRANYKMVQQIYKSATFKSQQKTQIEQALQMYQQGGTQQPTVTTDTTSPTVTPTVTQ